MELSGQAYQEALDYIYSFVDLGLTRNLRYSPEKFNLDRMNELMKMLGNPQKDYQVIHIAGTKGKGSTAAFIESVLRSAGYKTGFYSSPHLQDYNERIQTNGKKISNEDFVKFVEEIKPYVALIPGLSTFEITTAIGFLYFSRQQVEFAVVEVGLGGRLDATNIVEPLVSVITSLSLDHTNVLGDTLAKIAAEKAGIIKQNRPAVLAPQNEEALQVVRRVAEQQNSKITHIGMDILYASQDKSLEGQHFFLWEKNEQSLVDDFLGTGEHSRWETHRFFIPLLGFHQIQNAVTAYGAIKVIKENGFKISDDAILDGFSSVYWPGRFEIIQKKPLIIVDSAHNRDSALKLRLTIDDYLPGAPVILIFGASEDKDVEGMFAELLPRVERVIATKSTHPRALETQTIVKLAQKFGSPTVETGSVEEALEIAIQFSNHNNVILATGSLFVAAAVKAILNKSVMPTSIID